MKLLGINGNGFMRARKQAVDDLADIYRAPVDVGWIFD